MPPVAAYTEEELVALLKQQSRGAFDHLYTNYSAVLYGIICRIINDEQIAQDVLQDSFVKIWKNIGQYDAAKGRLFTWMINIARNTAIDKTRSKGELMRGKIYSDDQIVYNTGESKGVELKTDSIGLKEMVATLKEEQQSIIQLAYFKGYTLEEVSQALEIPLGTVKTRLRSGIKTLRGFFSK
jgi:RNA polymerase sigma-70 factor (ECF subfamily)